MFFNQETNQIKQELKTFFKKLDFEVSFDVSFEKETLMIKVKTDEPQVLIGERGRVLIDIQRLLRIILIHKLGRVFYVDLDINEYKQKKKQYLKEMAKEAADKTALSKKETVLPAMSAYERRIIHLELADRRDVATESIGREPERKVVIRLCP